MNRIFNPSAFFKIPDNTFLSPFLNSKDSMSGLPFDLINGFSIAMGRIEKNTSSLIHVHPYVDQVTFVLSGKINLRMKGNNESKPYKVILGNNQAGIAIKGEFFQLINPYDEDCNVLFIVSPDYLFELKDGQVIYDDAIILNESWEELQNLKWLPPGLMKPENSLEARRAAYQRLSKNKTIHS